MTWSLGFLSAWVDNDASAKARLLAVEHVDGGLDDHKVLYVDPTGGAGGAGEVVDTIEFYNASLDHYFVTTSSDEINKLDTGFFIGWKRTGLSFKVAAVPFHAWAPPAYDGAPLPVAAFLSTASKLGGVIAILYVALDALRPAYDIVAPTIAVLAVLSMTVGNLVALRQDRMVRLLAWSSVAQAGYILAPLAARVPGAAGAAATLGYTFLYLVLELGAFGAVIALRGDDDGGAIADYAGAVRRAPWAAGALALALVGLAGLPPGLAGLFAKVVVVRALLATGTGWLAVVVALNAVLGLAYYLRAAATLFAPTPAAARTRVPWPVAAALVGATVAAVVVGFAPQLVLAATQP